MCGIIAYIGQGNATFIALEGLKRLEYRGYDSWGIAWSDNGTIHLVRKTGRIGESRELPDTPSRIAIAHTRWATHGAVEERNAHPLLSNDQSIAVVHNGIIENYASLRRLLGKSHFRFGSDTDTEVIPNLIQQNLKKTGEFGKAFEKTISQLEGRFAIVALNNADHTLAFARKGSPLCVGLGEGETFVASDVSAFLSHTKQVTFLNDGEYGFVSSNSLVIRRLGSKAALNRKPITLDWDAARAEKGGYPHFMLKEILEQPQVITDTLTGRIDGKKVLIEELAIPKSYLRNLRKIVVISCGTAYYASLISRYMLEDLAKLDVEADYASEFRYRSNRIDKAALYIFISQSGETADTLAAMRRAKEAGAKTLSIVNVMGSTLARESTYVLYTRAGPEIGVASTKAFISQLVTMLLISIQLGSLTRKLSAKREAQLVRQLGGLSRAAHKALKSNIAQIKACARKYAKSKSLLYIGRNLNYPIALEGALKLKEISYLHAEGFPAGELKHGPIALVDEHVPSVCIAPDSSTYAKMASNIQEIRARNGPIIAVATEGDSELPKLADHTLFISKVDELLSPILTVLPLQLLAYHIALSRGCDIDKPKNLAKSVTVE